MTESYLERFIWAITAQTLVILMGCLYVGLILNDVGKRIVRAIRGRSP